MLLLPEEERAHILWLGRQLSKRIHETRKATRFHPLAPLPDETPEERRQRRNALKRKRQGR